MRGVWPVISEEEKISAHFVQGKKNSFLVFYTPVNHCVPPRGVYSAQEPSFLPQPKMLKEALYDHFAII